jgi:hypothetical protein
MVAAGTYALFTDDVGVKTHLQAGTLDATLERVNLDKWSIDPTTGFFVNKKSDEIVNFSGETTRNVFDMTDKEVIVPLSSYIADMRITNNSNVAFRYWIEIVINDTVKLELADQIYVEITSVNGKIEGYLSKLTTNIGSEENPISTVSTEKGKNSENFKISVRFDNLENKVNNTAMGQSVDFDVVVHAVQVVPPTESPAPQP